MRDEHWIVTYSGRQFWPLDPSPDEIFIEDIAHALSNICRFGGHCREFYSVAQHSVLVSKICAGPDALHGLLHDAAEAYCGDMVRPIKKHSTISIPYRVMETNIFVAIAKKFNVSIVTPDSVKWADEVALITEKRDLVIPHEYEWSDVHGGRGKTPLLQHINPVSPHFAETMFLNRFFQLTGEATHAASACSGS